MNLVATTEVACDATKLPRLRMSGPLRDHWYDIYCPWYRCYPNFGIQRYYYVGALLEVSPMINFYDTLYRYTSSIKAKVVEELGLMPIAGCPPLPKLLCSPYNTVAE